MNCPQDPEELDELISEPSDAVVRAVAGGEFGKIGVLGAGGKMGFHFCLKLQRALDQRSEHATVTAISRFGKPETVRKFERHGIRVIRTDLCDPESLPSLPEFDTVFFLAGVKFGTKDQPELLQAVNAKLPAAVCNRYADASIVALSSGCVYSFSSPHSGGSTEVCATEPPGDYAASCLQREHAFSRAAETAGTKSALIRLNYSIDLRYGVLHDIAKCVLNGQAIDLSTGYVNVIWQGDAIEHAILARKEVAAPPFVINVTGPEILSVRELSEEFGREFDRKVHFVSHEQESCWLNDASLAHRLFGKPRLSIATMVKWTADWIRAGKPSLEKPTHFGTRDGNY